MGTDYFHQGHFVIDESLVNKVAPSAFQAFNELAGELAREMTTIDSERIEGASETSASDVFKDFAILVSAYTDDGDFLDYEQYKRMQASYDMLCATFKGVTGLDLYLHYVGEGLRGSDISDESFWAVDGVLAKTAAALSFEQNHHVALDMSYHQDAG